MVSPIFSFQSCFVTSSLQFGFKPGFSADLCTGLLKNVIQENDTHVFGCFLDASKAFDCVNHTTLFEKLLRRDLPLPVASIERSTPSKINCVLPLLGTPEVIRPLINMFKMTYTVSLLSNYLSLILFLFLNLNYTIIILL